MNDRSSQRTLFAEYMNVSHNINIDRHFHDATWKICPLTFQKQRISTRQLYDAKKAYRIKHPTSFITNLITSSLKIILYFIAFIYLFKT
ncbi:hypothetical protein PUN28_019124 [Cardiocondyla obscurior]|uniref:Uncharacterized protein n=1 Tax=Cardiocondyla obscurior TaxID=286306 RepID=A0AAW2EDJ6_9HYME